MKNKYEATYILDLQSKEELVKEAIIKLTKEIESFGGKVSNTQRLDRRKFERVAGKLDTGYYLIANFEMDTQKLAGLKKKLQLDDLVYRQFYLVDDGKQSAPVEKEAAPAVA
ncbi:MAG: 30S ribosomal protein S6 [Verrucomicrobiota bacterium]